jgi:23S rRNA pseudouridine1911/1915/1917 synthase
VNLNCTIGHDFAGKRLDALIVQRVPSCARSKAAWLINSGQIQVNHGHKKPGYRLRTGDLITGTTPDRYLNAPILPQNIAFDICHEDDHILVINKPAGMVVHPATGHMADTLVNALLYYCPRIKMTCQDKHRSGIVHRLDKDTTGLMVVAKTRHAFKFLQNEFKQRRVEKKYMALVHGHLLSKQGYIDLPIGRHPVKRKIMAVQPDTGKRALTLWTVKRQFKTASLVEIILKTGRTHQIRVHFYAMGHPLIGDTVYQFRKNRKKNHIVSRQMLHSFFLGFRHPYSGRRMEFKTDLPQDFLSVLSTFN